MPSLLTIPGPTPLLGVAYYPEHDPESEWPRDAVLMRELGLNAVRVGEFCWNRLQQADGTLTLDWLARLVDLYHAHGIGVVLCTPSATPPVWAVERFPDLAPVLPNGRRGEFGGRRHYSVFHPGYRDLSVALAAALAERFGRHPGVIGWHIDNEVGSYSVVDCSPVARRAWHRHLAAQYGSVAELNQRWGLIFWNQEVSRFDQVPTPGEMMCTRSPQMLLEYNRFCLAGACEFVEAQARVMRPHLGPGQWLVASATEPVSLALFERQRQRGDTLFDLVELNNYPELLPAPGEAAMRLDLMRAVDRPRPFITLEMQTGSGYTTSGGLDGRVRRFWAWETLARGSLGVAWFHWRRFRTGCEWRHTSIVERDRQPRAVYREVQALLSELRRAAPWLAGATVRPDLQILLLPDSIMARDRASEPLFWMEIQLPDARHTRYPLWEQEVRRALYQPLSAMGCTLDFVRLDETWDPRLPLFIPEADLVTEPLLAKLRAFLAAGGTLICFPGVGERDAWGAQTEAPSPGALGPLFGIVQDDVYPLAAGIGGTWDSALGRLTNAGEPSVDCRGSLRLGELSVAVDVRHAEIPRPLDAATEVLASYGPGLAAGRPAITRHRPAGTQGQAIYLGAVPADAAAAATLWQALLPALGQAPAGYSQVKLATGQGPLTVLLNGNPQAATLREPVADLLSGSALHELAPWGIALQRG